MSGDLSGEELGSLQVDAKSGSAEMKIGLLKLEGTVTKLKSPLLVVTKKGGFDGGNGDAIAEDGHSVTGEGVQSRELEAVAIVRKKIIFQTRPIPLSVRPQGDPAPV